MNEKAYNRKQSRGDLRVRVQTLGMHSDITADTAINNVITKEGGISHLNADVVLAGQDLEQTQSKCFH